MFCAPRLVFGGTEGVRSRFQVLRFWTRFRWYRGCRLPFSCFARPDSLSALPRASSPVFMFCALGHVFLRCRVRRVSFSCFVLPDSFSALPRASAPIFIFCSLGLDFGGTEGVESRFQVLRPDSFSAVPWASYHIFKFCARGLIFNGTEGVGSRFHIWHALTRFRRIRGCQVSFSCFALPESFPAVPRASGPVFMFCALFRFRRYRGHRLTFSCFTLPDSFSAVPMASVPVFKFCAPGLVFGGTEGVRSHFNVFALPDTFSAERMASGPVFFFACPDSFSAVPRVSSPVFMFCASIVVSRGTEGVVSRFLVLRSRTRFRRYQGRQVLFSCFARPDSFSAVPRASAIVFLFCAPRLVFGGTEGVGSRFHVLRARTHFRRY
jgi:hypothetical protein